VQAAATRAKVASRAKMRRDFVLWSTVQVAPCSEDCRVVDNLPLWEGRVWRRYRSMRQVAAHTVHAAVESHSPVEVSR